MSDDFLQLEFHKLKKADLNSKSIGNARLSEIPCLVNKEKCVGFEKHSSRPICTSCKCFVWQHDVPQDAAGHPFQRMNVDEALPPLISEYEKALTEGYTWVPRGLRTSQIDVYMKHFDQDTIPKLNSVGSNYRARQLMHQLPIQDFYPETSMYLKEEEKNSCADLSEKRIEDAVGVGAARGAISAPAKCFGCSDTINPGSMAIFAERFGDKYCWHPQCFRCCVDDNSLVDLIYFHHNNNLYCGRHWSEQLKPRCYACEELIFIGEYTKAMDKTWHLDHFLCWECNVSLTGQKYIIINDQPYCQPCYGKSIANKCFECNQPIGPDSKDMLVKDRHYHKECLLCTQCGRPLESQTFSFINDSPVCHKCRGVDPEKSKNCHICNHEFLPDEKKVGVGQEYFHEKCFLCSQCESPIGSQRFIKKNDGRRLCNSCFEETARKCAKCGDIIKGSTVKFEGKAFHTDCFVCSNCKKQLGGVQFYKNEDEPFCDECYLSTHAKRCASCYEPIEGNTKFIDYDRKYWHSKCFVCEKCKKPLAGAKFVIRDGVRFCMDCK